MNKSKRDRKQKKRKRQDVCKIKVKEGRKAIKKRMNGREEKLD